MELAIRNKWFTIGGSSIVKDVNEKDVLNIKGKVFSFTRKKFVQDLEGNTKYMVRNKFWRIFQRKAFVYNDKNELVATIRRKIFSLRDRYFVESKFGNIEIDGNILQFNYHIKLNDKEIGHVARKVSLRDSFVLTIPDDVDYMFYVSLVIAVDLITDRRDDDISNAIDSMND